MLYRKLTIGALFVVLAAFLFPGLAMGDTLGGATMPDSDKTESSQSLATQAVKKMWVVSGTKTTNSSETYTSKYHYNKSGLLDQVTTAETNGVISLEYDGANLTKFDQQSKWPWNVHSYNIVSKNGKPVSAKSADGALTIKFKYYPSGTIKSCTKISSTGKSTTTYKLNEKGYPVKVATKGVAYPHTEKYTYSKYGDMASQDFMRYKCTYKKGLLMKRGNCKVTYKMVAVDKRYAGLVKAQQWAIRNQNLNGAFGPASFGVGNTAL